MPVAARKHLFDLSVDMATKKQATERWVRAVNADGRHGTWAYAIARAPEDVAKRVEEAAHSIESTHVTSMSDA